MHRRSLGSWAQPVEEHGTVSLGLGRGRDTRSDPEQVQKILTALTPKEGVFLSAACEPRRGAAPGKRSMCAFGSARAPSSSLQRTRYSRFLERQCATECTSARRRCRGRELVELDGPEAIALVECSRFEARRRGQQPRRRRRRDRRRRGTAAARPERGSPRVGPTLEWWIRAS